MRELTISELSAVSGSGAFVRPLLKKSLEATKSAANNPVVQGGAAGGATYVAGNAAAGNKMSPEGAAGAVVGGMFGGRFGGSFNAAIAGSISGGLIERSIKTVNNIKPPYKPDNESTEDKSGNSYGH